MNDGKVCISVCAEFAEEFVEKTRRAAQIADIVELRFDCLENIKNEDLWSGLYSIYHESETPYLFTYRPKAEGGMRELTDAQRSDFWYDAVDIDHFIPWVDMEIDMIDNSPSCYFERLICSRHDFEKTPANLEEIYDQSAATFAGVIKIAVQADEITNCLPVWKLLQRAMSDGKEIIPIAMGEAGKWTRILGLAHGSPLTYASLEEGNETAPGQISARDLIDIYRVKELTKETEIYGIIGNPVSHSLSPYIHNPAFKEMGIDAVYIPFEVSNLDEFVKRMVRPETREIDWNLQGFSVTAPHKESILKHLDFIDNAAEKIGAVNTVKIVDNRLCGFNTDAEGFIEPLRKNFGDLKNARAGIIGNGGAARACLYALKNDGAEVTIIARDTERGNALANEFEAGFFKLDQNENAFPEFDILINASPLGTYGKLEDQTPIAADRLSNLQLAYDLVYNPFETRFLREAKSKGVKTIGGFEMLIAQAARQFEIWTGSKAPADKFAETALLRLKESK